MLLTERTKVLLYFVLNGKLVNSKTFQSLNIKYWPCQARMRETIMIWKKMENIKNPKIVSVSWHHVLTEMFTITEKPSLLFEKVKLTSPNPSRHDCLPLIFYRLIVLGITFSTLGNCFLLFLFQSLVKIWSIPYFLYILGDG